LAFLTTLVREIIKDIEDIDGDKNLQCNTIPIFWGIPKTKIIIQLLILLTIAYVALVLKNNFYGNRILNFWYLLSFFVIPFAALSYLVFTANEKKDFYYAGLFSKILMAAGVLTILPFWYYFIR
jgi:4-hydroxybenzoate polyprenyltransferase